MSSAGAKRRSSSVPCSAYALRAASDSGRSASQSASTVKRAIASLTSRPKNSRMAAATRSTVAAGISVCSGKVMISRVTRSVTLRSPRRQPLRNEKSWAGRKWMPVAMPRLRR